MRFGFLGQLRGIPWSCLYLSYFFGDRGMFCLRLGNLLLGLGLCCATPFLCMMGDLAYLASLLVV